MRSRPVQFLSVSKLRADSSSSLSQAMVEAIRATGPLSFREFMSLALYHETHGYYAQNLDSIGRNGDFITSVSAGECFGALLVEQFHRWSRHLGGSSSHPISWFECGAHDGRLAADVLDYCQKTHPESYQALRLIILEPSLIRRSAQEQNLASHQELIQWIEDWEDIPTRSIEGIIYSNELLDAFPVERISWDAKSKQWFRWGVTETQGQLSWCRLATDRENDAVLDRFISSAPAALEPYLPDGFTTEFSPEAIDWWSAASERLRNGYLIAFDYGFTRNEFFAPQRHRGTLRAYHRHHLSQDLLAQPGHQDLTAHVNFTDIQEAGELAGLETIQLDSQEKFLSRILSETIKENPESPLLEADRVSQIKTLIHPNHFGRSFSVLVQKR